MTNETSLRGLHTVQLPHPEWMLQHVAWLAFNQDALPVPSVQLRGNPRAQAGTEIVRDASKPYTLRFIIQHFVEPTDADFFVEIAPLNAPTRPLTISDLRARPLTVEAKETPAVLESYGLEPPADIKLTARVSRDSELGWMKVEIDCDGNNDQFYIRFKVPVDQANEIFCAHAP